MKKIFATSIAMILVGIIIFAYSTRLEASGAEMFYGLVGCATLLIGGFLILAYEIIKRLIIDIRAMIFTSEIISYQKNAAKRNVLFFDPFTRSTFIALSERVEKDKDKVTSLGVHEEA